MCLRFSLVFIVRYVFIHVGVTVLQFYWLMQSNAFSERSRYASTNEILLGKSISGLYLLLAYVVSFVRLLSDRVTAIFLRLCIFPCLLIQAIGTGRFTNETLDLD